MTNPASILLVDDDPKKLLALSTLVEDLAEEVVMAQSGREALRLVLSREFAVILLDIRMFGLDGFETAELIRQRKSSQHTPIIFITAFTDDEFSARGYALGAVDFITTPVRPDSLRSKVAVFLDLFKKARQINRQAASLERRAEQLHQLSRASLAINGALGLEEMLDTATRWSRELVGASDAVTLAQLDPNAPKLKAAASIPDSAPGERAAILEEAAVFASLFGETPRPVRATIEELGWDPKWEALRERFSAGRRFRPRMAAPLMSREGRGMGGWFCVSGEEGRAFTQEDEGILAQLGQVTSIALENTLFSEAREANRLKDEFLTTLSHELRTPLTAILGWVRLLKAAGPMNERFENGLNVIERNVTAQARLIEDLLDVSRIMAGKLRLVPGAVKPVALVEAAVQACLPSAHAKGIQILVVVDPSLSRVDVMEGDPDRLEQVIWNLLSNAIKFTPKGGHVEVRVDRVAEQLRLRVIDDGQGINPGFLKHVFDRFRQADSSTTSSQGGLGIGLALVRHIVEGHGGHVSAESAGVGKGATFTVILPSAPVSATVSSPASDEEAPLVDGPEICPGCGPRRGRRAGCSRRPARDPDPRRRPGLDRRLGARGSPCARQRALRRPRERHRDARDRRHHAHPQSTRVGGLHDPRRRGHRVCAGGRPPARPRPAGFQAHLAKPVEPAALLTAVRQISRTGSAAAEARSEEKRLAAERERPRRVLVIEDDVDSREALKQLLELAGHVVDATGSALEGVAKAIQERPEVAFVDIGLPEIDGHEVARRIRQQLGTNTIYLVAVSGYSGETARSQALDAGFDAHIAKPLNPDRLRELMQIGR